MKNIKPQSPSISSVTLLGSKARVVHSSLVDYDAKSVVCYLYATTKGNSQYRTQNTFYKPYLIDNDGLNYFDIPLPAISDLQEYVLEIAVVDELVLGGNTAGSAIQKITTDGVLAGTVSNLFIESQDSTALALSSFTRFSKARGAYINDVLVITPDTISNSAPPYLNILLSADGLQTTRVSSISVQAGTDYDGSTLNSMTWTNVYQGPYKDSINVSSGLTLGVEYTFRVTTTFGDGSASTEYLDNDIDSVAVQHPLKSIEFSSSAIVPLDFNTLSFEAFASWDGTPTYELKVSWDWQGTDSSKIRHFEIQQVNDNSITNATNLQALDWASAVDYTTAPSSTNLFIPSVPLNQTYAYRIRAVGWGSESNRYSNWLYNKVKLVDTASGSINFDLVPSNSTPPVNTNIQVNDAGFSAYKDWGLASQDRTFHVDASTGNVSIGGDKLIFDAENSTLSVDGSAIVDDITAANFVLDWVGGVAPSIKTSNKTGYASAGSGLWTGYTDATTFKFDLGDDNRYIRWDGSGLRISGNVTIDVPEDVSNLSPGDIGYTTLSLSATNNVVLFNGQDNTLRESPTEINFTANTNGSSTFISKLVWQVLDANNTDITSSLEAQYTGAPENAKKLVISDANGILSAYNSLTVKVYYKPSDETFDTSNIKDFTKIGKVNTFEEIAGLEEPFYTYLTNDNQAVPVDSEGKNPSLSEATGDIKIFQGLSDLSNSADTTYTVVDPDGCGVSLVGNTYTVSSVPLSVGVPTKDSYNITLRATYTPSGGTPVSYDKVFSLFISKQGEKGNTGPAPTVINNNDGTYTITGENGSVDVSDGINGDPPTITTNADGSYTVDNGVDPAVTFSSGIGVLEYPVSPAAIGGGGNIKFLPNIKPDGTADPGEVGIVGNTLVHPDGSSITIDQTRILTPFEGTGYYGKFYIVYSATNVRTRFSTMNQVSDNLEDGHLFLAYYNQEATTPKWEVVGNLSATLDLTFESDDAILAEGQRILGDSKITRVTSYINFSPIKGIDYIDGTNGEYVSFIYQNSSSPLTTAPTGGTFNGTTETFPTSWTDTAQEPALDETRYMSTVRYVHDVATNTWSQKSAWSVPIEDYSIPTSSAYSITFETAAEKAVLVSNTGTTKSESNDAFNGSTAMLLTSSSADGLTSGAGNRISIEIPYQHARSFKGQLATISVAMKQGPTPSSRVGIVYSTNADGNSGFIEFSPTANYLVYTFDYYISPASTSSSDYIIINPDLDGLGGQILLDDVLVTIKGDKGDKGDKPTVVNNNDGTYTVTGENGSIVIKDGIDADPPTVTDNGDGTYTVSNSNGDSVIIKDGDTPIKTIDYFDGNNGDFVSFVYKNSTTDLSSSPPTGGSFNGTTETLPTGWTDVAEEPTIEEARFVSSIRYSHDSVSNTWTQVGDWSTPVLNFQRGIDSSYANLFDTSVFKSLVTATASVSMSDTTDSFSGSNALLLTSTRVNGATSGSGDSLYVEIPNSYARAFAGQNVTISVAMKTYPTSPSSEVGIAYSTNKDGNSGWARFTPSAVFTTHSFDYKVPQMTELNPDYIIINPDMAGSGAGIILDDLRVTIKGETPEYGVDYFDGSDGDYVSFVYKTSGSDLSSSPPTNGSFDGVNETLPDGGWSDNPTDFTHPSKRWVSSRRYEHNAVTGVWSAKNAWSTPVVHGEKGDVGDTLYTWIKNANPYYTWEGEKSWSVNGDVAGSAKFTISSTSAVNAHLRLKLKDAEGNVWVDLNGTTILSNLNSPASDVDVWFSKDVQLQAGNNVLDVYNPSSASADGGFVKQVDVINEVEEDNPNATYIGVAYNKSTATESTNVHDYVWTLVQGNQGVPGEPGEPGEERYTWIKYSANSNGNPMTDTPNAASKYIGLKYNNTSPTESSDFNDYDWFQFRGNDGDTGSRAPAFVESSTTQDPTLASVWSGGTGSHAYSKLVGLMGNAVAFDMLTLYNASTPSKTDTKMWNGSSWESAVKINGNIIADGTVGAKAIVADEGFFDDINVNRIYNHGGSSGNYKMMIDFQNGAIHIRGGN